MLSKEKLEIMPKVMNICFLCRTFLRNRGGTEAYYCRMAKALSAQGHSIHIVTQEGKETSYSDKLDQSVHVHTINFNEEPFKGSWRIERFFPLSRIRYSMAVAKKIKEIQKKYKIDIVQAPDWSSAGFWLSITKTVPLIIRLHGTPDFRDYLPSPSVKPNLRMRLTWIISKYMIFNADGVSSVSNDFAQFLKNIYGYKKTIDVIYNGIDQEIYKPGNILERERIILYVGRLEEPKGIEVVAKAIPQIIKDFPNIKFVFAGRATSYKNEQKTWADYLKHEFSNNVILLGPISAEEVVSYYQKNLISIFPSIYEPGGAAALEAMACGCAVIATKVGGLPESIDHEQDGLLIPPNDPEALSNAIKRLIKDDALRRKIAVNAIQKVTTKFNLKKSVEQTVQLYEKIVR